MHMFDSCGYINLSHSNSWHNKYNFLVSEEKRNKAFREFHNDVVVNIPSNGSIVPGWMFVPMMTSSNGNIFRVTGRLCGEFTGHRWIPRTKASDAELWCFMRLIKRLSKRSRGWWFETTLRPLWRHCNASMAKSLLTPVSNRFNILNCFW